MANLHLYSTPGVLVHNLTRRLLVNTVRRYPSLDCGGTKFGTCHAAMLQLRGCNFNVTRVVDGTNIVTFKNV